MKFCIKQKVFSWNDRFQVRDDHGNELYTAESEFLTLGKKLHVHDRQGDEVIYIAQKLFTFMPRYELFAHGSKVGEVVKRFTIGFPAYDIIGPGWHIEGDFWQHDYEITGPDGTIAVIRKEWLTWGDCYTVDIADEALALPALSVVLVIDCVAAENA